MCVIAATSQIYFPTDAYILSAHSAIGAPKERLIAQQVVVTSTIPIASEASSREVAKIPRLTKSVVVPAGVSVLRTRINVVLRIGKLPEPLDRKPEW